jgi:hypothetical protein
MIEQIELMIVRLVLEISENVKKAHLPLINDFHYWRPRGIPVVEVKDHRQHEPMFIAAFDKN